MDLPLPRPVVYHQDAFICWTYVYLACPVLRTDPADFVYQQATYLAVRSHGADPCGLVPGSGRQSVPQTWGEGSPVGVLVPSTVGWSVPSGQNRGRWSGGPSLIKKVGLDGQILCLEEPEGPQCTVVFALIVTKSASGEGRGAIIVTGAQVESGVWGGMPRPPPLPLADSVTIDAKTTMDCSPDSSMCFSLCTSSVHTGRIKVIFLNLNWVVH